MKCNLKTLFSFETLIFIVYDIITKKNNILQKSLKLLMMLILMTTSVALFSQQKLSNVKIYMPKDANQRLDLLGLLEVDHFHEIDGAFNYTVDQEQLQLLKATGTKYDVINEDAIAYLEAENNKYYESIKNGKTQRIAFEQGNQTVDNIIKTPTDFKVQSTLGGYYSFAQMVAAIDTIIAKYPGITQKFSIGKTTENRDMWCVKISDSVALDQNEPEILFMGHHHAREAIGGASMIFLMQYLCENYSKDARIKDLVDNREIFIIVCANPDGWEWNRTQAPTGGFQWRKNRRVNGSSQYGVDLNRNWGVNWANCTGAIGASSCGSSTTSSDVYWGPSQYSEPETRNLRLFCRAHDFGTIMDQHSVGPNYSNPWGRLPPTGVAMSAADDAVYVQMASVMGKYNGMRYGSTYETLGYEVSGGMKDVLLKGDDSLPNGKCYGMTGEGSNGSSSTSFWPLAADIIKLCKGMVYQDIQLMYTVGSYVELQDSTNMNIQSKTGKLYFSLRRIGLQNQPVRVTAIPIENVYSVGAFKTVATTSLPNFNSIYKDSIAFTLSSSIASGNSFSYAWKIETGGYTYYDTITAIYQPNVLFTDNMEGSTLATNWTKSSGSLWDYTNDAAYRGSKSLAESPGGTKYTDNLSITLQKATNLNLSGAGVAYLSFWTKYRTENYRDKMHVEVSTNGTTWIAVSGRNTVKEPGTADGSTINGVNSLTGIYPFWHREVFDLSAYVGQTALRLRFRFTSAANSVYIYDNDNGFNIDDLTIITGATPTVLPVELTNFSGYNAGSTNILNWTTASELNTQSFIIERSTNGRDYEPIGTVVAAGNSRTPLSYSYIDEQPYNGENIYRLKMMDLDGKFKYSKLVSIVVRSEENTLTKTGINSIFPNPTKENISVKFQVNEDESVYNISIFNAFGQIMKNEKMTFIKGEQIIKINTSGFANGQYIISFNDAIRGISYEQKFIKQ